MMLFILGCSSGTGDPVGVDTGLQTANAIPAGDGIHSLWGLWEFKLDAATQTLEAVPKREADIHLNALKFLEPMPYLYLTIDGISIEGNIVKVLLGLRHPFLALDQFTGFDVCGIIFTTGTVTGFSDPDLVMAGEGDIRLLNADGYTRWWNPSEFPHTQTVFGYRDGLLGAPYGSAGYNCTLNGYKYFCDDLEAKDPMENVSIEGRGVFTAGQKNVREYIIEMNSSGLVFNYAIDACWKYPTGSAPWDVPDDFHPDANRPEPYRIAVTELDNTLWNDGASSGGSLSLSIDVWDHFYNDANTLQVESAGSFGPENAGAPVGGGEGYSTYEVEVLGAHPTNSDTIDVLIKAGSENVGYQGLLPGETECAYFIYEAEVDDEGPVVETYGVIGFPDWCALTEGCTNGVDNLQLVTNVVQQDLDGPYNDEMIVKWWEGHLNWNPGYSTSIINNHINSLGYTFVRTSETAFDPTGCRVVIVVFIGPNESQYNQFTADDIQNMKDFVKNGGILCIMIEHTNYFNPITCDPLLDSLGIPLSYGGPAEPPSTYTTTTDITPHDITTGVSTFQYWTAGEWVLESDECISIVRSPTGEHLVVGAPIDVE